MLGILTRSDVLRVYLRDDEDLRREVAEVLPRALTCDAEVEVQVRDGVVRLDGWVQRSSCGWAAAAVRAVPGVVDLDNQLSYRVDDALDEQLALLGPFA